MTGKGEGATMRFPSIAMYLSNAPRALALLALTAAPALPACGGADLARTSANGPNGGSFGSPATEDGGAGGDAAATGDGGVGPTGPSASVRLVHTIPNLSRVVLCRFDALGLDDITTVDVDELTRDDHSGEPLMDGELRERGLGFGEVSEWLRVPVRGTGVLTLHRVPEPPAPEDGGLSLGDAGLGDAGLADAGFTDAGSVDAAADAGLDDPCDPARLEVALPLPLPDTWLAPEVDADGGPLDGGASGGFAGDASVDRLGERGLARELLGGARLTLFATGLLLDAEQLTDRAEAARTDHLATHAGDARGAEQAARDAVRSLDQQFGPRLLASPAPEATSENTSALTLAHAVPDALAGGLRACINTDGLEGRALPAIDAPAVGFRSRVALSRELSPAAGYRVRVFPADTFGAPGQDCANTTRAPLASYDAPPASLTSGGAATLLVLGLLSPESVCSAGAAAAVARAGCFGAVPPTLRAVLLAD